MGCMVGVLAAYYDIYFLVFLLTVGTFSFFMLLLLKYPNKTLIFLCLLLVFSLFFISDIQIGGIGLRLDDFITIFLTLFLLLIFTFKKNTVTYPPGIKWFLLFYLLYSALISIVNLIVKDLHPIFLLFFLKEIQYFIYFISFYFLIMKYDHTNKIVNMFTFGSISTVIWGTIQLVTGNYHGHYGIGTISAQTASQSGALFFIITTFFLYRSVATRNSFNKLVFFILSLIATIMTVATIARAALIVVLAVYVMYISFSIFRKRWNLKRIIIAIYLVVPACFIGYQLIGDTLDYVIHRFSYLQAGVEGRVNHWIWFLGDSGLFGSIFGNGKGYMQVITGTFTLNADNHYVRLIVEVGVIGLILWCAFMASILIFGLTNLKTNYTDSMFLLIITLAFMLYSLSQEVFMVAIQGSIYWILAGFFIGKINREKKWASH